MRIAKTASAEDYKLLSGFEAIRKTLLEQKFADRLEKPLAYWALPNDRRLPLAFLGRSLGDLLATSFEDLSRTPGIGHKKISSLVKLLHRAVEDDPPASPFGIQDFAEGNNHHEHPHSSCNGQFNPLLVSEAMWVQWRETVRRHDCGQEKLGRLAVTLESLPTVIWHTPLNYYLDYTLAEIRLLKTHGEKRVRAVLEIFYLVNQTLGSTAASRSLAFRLLPRFVPSIERWIAAAMDASVSPSLEEVRQHLAIPLLDQILIDAGPVVHTLAEGRLGIQAAPQSVRQQSRRMGVTRARVYQLLEDCCKLMQVRWPEGKYLLKELVDKISADPAAKPSVTLCTAVRDLFYPDKCEREEEDGCDLQP